MGKWHGIMRITELVHSDRFGRTIQVRHDLFNTMHLLGEEFVLGVLFSGGQIPGSYYIGLDARASLSASDAISGLNGLEPVGKGYERAAVDSDNFSVVSSPSGRQANSPTVLFTATEGPWITVKNIFLCTGLGYGQGSVLISSAPIGQDIRLSSGETISMRMAMAIS
jgi:hypothetical protein